MPKRISIDNAITILEVIGEEDSIGLDNDVIAQRAITMLQNRIDKLIESGAIQLSDILISFE